MDIEQLKLILEAARAAGDGAMSVVLVWFAYKFLGVLLNAGLIGGLIVGAYKLIGRGITVGSAQGRIHDITGLDCAFSSEKKRFLTWLRNNWTEQDYG